MTILNVFDYGAVGDGTTDDTTAVQDTIDAVPVGGCVYFPSGFTYLVGDLTIDKQLQLFGYGAAGVILKQTGTITVDNGLENGLVKGIEATGVSFLLDDDSTTRNLIDIYGGNSFSRFTKCRFLYPTERMTTLTLTGVSGTFVAEDTITSGTASALCDSVAGSDLIVHEDNDKFEVGNVVTNGSATGTVSSITRKGHTCGVRFIGSTSVLIDDVFRPTVYNTFDQCEFFNLKFGVKGQYAGYKKFNETHFFNCSFQYCDYNVFDGQQASGIKFFGGGQEVWKKTGIYSDGDENKIFGTRFERAAATEASYVVSFTNAEVSTANNTITFTAHTFKNGDEVVLESPRDGSNRNTVVWPAGLTPGEVYYIVEKAANTVKLATSAGGSAIDITTTGNALTFYLRKLSNIPYQFGKNSTRCGAIIPHFNLSGGPEKYRYDGVQTAHIGMRENELNSNLTLKGVSGQTDDLLAIKDVDLNVMGGFSKGGAYFERRNAITTSGVGTITIDADLGAYWNVNVFHNITGVTINNGRPGQELTIRFTYGGAFTVAGLATSSQYMAGSAFTGTAANGKIDVVRFKKDANNNKWYESAARTLNLF